MKLPAATAAALVLAAAASLGLSVQSARRAADHLRSLNDAHPPLADAPPVLVPPPGRAARTVVLVVLDGLRADTSRGLPALEALRARGASAVAHTHFPSISSPNYVSLLTGVPPRHSGVRTNDYAGRVAVDNLFARVRAAGLRSAYVSQLSEAVPELFPDADEAVLAPWPGTAVSAARAAIARGVDFLVVVHNAPDEAGHAHGAASRAYRDAAAQADRDLGEIVAALDLERDAVLVTADHGHTDAGGHGGVEPEVMAVPLVLAGAGIRPGARIDDAALVDLAPTAAALLGVASPGHALGRTLVEALAVPAPDRLRIADAMRRGIVDALATQLAAARARAADATQRQRGLELASLALATLAFVVWAHRRGAVFLDARALCAGVLPGPVVLSAFVVLVGGLTPSVVAGRPDAIAANAVAAGVLATAVHPLLVLGTFMGRPPRSRLRTAAGAALVGIFAALVCSHGAWALLGGDVLAERFFGPGDVVLPMLVQLAAAAQAGGVFLALVLEMVVHWSRASMRGRVAAAPARLVRAVP
ncbi:MAG TPA: alkaline phosphatase family protein [Haliangiales bacterium]|nr:alkaline phosphatase family protein [Haliangiales bacterium]